MDVLFDQQTDPAQRKERDKNNGEDDPAGRRDASLDPGQKLAHAIRAAITARHELGVARGERLRRRRRIARFSLSLILVGLPCVRAGSLVIVLTRLPLLLRDGLSDEELCPAESAKLALGCISLTAILALDHNSLRIIHGLTVNCEL